MKTPAVSPGLLSIRKATEEETRQNIPGWIGYIYRIIQSISNTFALLRVGGDYAKFFPERIQKRLITEIPSLERTWYLTSEPGIMRLIGDYHRNDPHGPFKIGYNDEIMLEIGKQIFGTEIAASDFIMTCGPDMTEKFRTFLGSYISTEKIAKYRSVIQEVIDHTLEQWQKTPSGRINVSCESQAFAAGVTSRLFLGLKEDEYRMVARAVSNTNRYIVLKELGSVNEEPFTEDAAKLLDIVNLALNSDTPFIQDLKSQPWTHLQKQSLILTMLFAGQENTASLLTFIIWQLAKDPDLQEKIYAEINKHLATNPESRPELPRIIENLFSEGIRLHPSSHTIERIARTNLVITDGENEFFIKQDGIITYTPRLAGLDCEKYSNASEIDLNRNHKNQLFYPFGSGKQRCPGQSLAQFEIKKFIMHIIQRFKFTTDRQENEQQAFYSLQLRFPVFISLQERTG